MDVPTLQVWMQSPIRVHNAGLFISRGDAMHPTRTLDSHELILVTQDELELWENDRSFLLAPGDVLHLWPGRQHGSVKPMPAALRFYWIHFEVLDAYQTHYGHPLAPYSVVDLPQHTRLPRPDALERLFRFFLNEQETGILCPASANLLMLLMLFEVGQQALEMPLAENTNPVATWAHNYIRMNFDRPITARVVAQALGYNVDYLGRVFRDTYHCTMTEAIQRRRIQKACDYLLNTALTVDQISTQCGFHDADYFRRVFKRIMQVSPAKYRQENARVHVTTH